MSHPDLLGTVLCGGASSRMGRDKAALSHPSGGTYLRHAVERMQGLVRQVVLAGRDAVPPEHGDWPRTPGMEPLVALADRHPRQGPLEGVLTALRYAERRKWAGALVTPVDMPYLTTEDLWVLVASFERDPVHPVAAVFEETAGEAPMAEPLVAVYPVAALDSLESAAVSGQRSLRRWLAERETRLCPLPCSAAANVNTPEDLSRRNAMDPVQQALEQLAGRLRSLEAHSVPVSEAVDRILASDVAADRDSPAADVSAMDGYAICGEDAAEGKALRVLGTSRPGHAPPDAPRPGQAVRIFTGGCVPAGCAMVVKREDVREPAGATAGEAKRASEDSIQLLTGPFAEGMNIRRRGENATAGSRVLVAGTLLHAGHIAAAANFGADHVQVSRRVRVQTVVTGDELKCVQDSVDPWELRDSNGATLTALMQRHRWIEAAESVHVEDDLEELVGNIEESLESYDAIVLTGGVSMGDFDYVPEAIRRAGGTVVFHKLPVRPGKPILGAVGRQGQLIMGLPGNPVSAAVGAVRFALPLLRKMCGAAPWLAPRPRVPLVDGGEKTLPLTWFRLVRIDGQGRATLVSSQGSGDLVSLANSDGFVELPPESSGPGPWPYWSW